MTTTVRVTVGTYLLAVISGVFVTFGAMLFFAFSHLFFGNWVPNAPKPILATIPWIAIGLGVLSAWRSIVIAKRKLVEKQNEDQQHRKSD